MAVHYMENGGAGELDGSFLACSASFRTLQNVFVLLRVSTVLVLSFADEPVDLSTWSQSSPPKYGSSPLVACT